MLERHVWDPVMSGRVVDWLQVIRSEFHDMPSMRLTTSQAEDRWPVPQTMLAAMLDVLADVRFLRRLPDGSYIRHPDWSDV
jgi:hypothetical protein